MQEIQAQQEAEALPWVLLGEEDAYWMTFGADPVTIGGPKTEEEMGYWWMASVRWDGCCEISRAGNVPFCKSYGYMGKPRDESAADTSFHCCDLSEMRAVLLGLQQAAERHHGEGFPF